MPGVGSTVQRWGFDEPWRFAPVRSPGLACRGTLHSSSHKVVCPARRSCLVQRGGLSSIDACGSADAKVVEGAATTARDEGDDVDTGFEACGCGTGVADTAALAPEVWVRFCHHHWCTVFGLLLNAQHSDETHNGEQAQASTHLTARAPLGKSVLILDTPHTAGFASWVTENRALGAGLRCTHRQAGTRYRASSSSAGFHSYKVAVGDSFDVSARTAQVAP